MSKPPERPRVLIADDVDENRELLRETIEPQGFDAFLVPSGELALKVARRIKPDLIILDIQMPGRLDGFSTCAAIKEDAELGEIPIIFISVDDDKTSLVKAFQFGAVDYIVKPFAKEEVLARVRTHVSLHRLTCVLLSKNQELSAEISRREQAEVAKITAEEKLRDADERLSFISEQEATRWGLSGFVGNSGTFRGIIDKIKMVQQSNSISVLINGESGTGKELIARAIHFGSDRSKGPFVPLNCSAIPTELAESMLFGHQKGAFSGAVQNKKGYFEMADGGTLFLDEIGDLPIGLQPKFLRVLEDSRFIPVGATEEIEVNVRVVAATNRSLSLFIDDGRFRADLYFRLARFTVDVPPLRERKGDVELLTRHFVRLFADEIGAPLPSISEEALELLNDYEFPGNIRELKNMLERGVIEAQSGQITPNELHFFKPKRSASETRDAGLIDRRGATSVDQVSEDKEESLSPEEEEIIGHVIEHGSLTNSECRELLDINIDRAYYLLNKLQKGGHLRRVGGYRGARYLAL